MKEIRLCWSVIGRTNQAGEPIQNGPWHQLNEYNLRDLEIIRTVGDEVCGKDTHWIEEREA
jgi:hypothetical protein